MRLEIKNGAAKFETIISETQKNIESEIDVDVSRGNEMLGVEESTVLYNLKGAIFFEKNDKDIIADVRTKSKPADNFVIYLVIVALIGLFTLVGFILFPIILWLVEESERKKAEKELVKVLWRSVKYAAERQKLEVR